MPTNLLILFHKLLVQFAILITGAGLFTAIDFSHTITLGSVLIAFLVVVISGIFTVRSRIANIWRQEAEGERAAKDRLVEELAAEKLSRIEFEKEQQEIRHDLKGEIAECKALLKIAETRTDLTGALEAIKELNAHTTEAIAESMRSISLLSQQRDDETHNLLSEIRDKLPNEPIAIRDVTTDK